MTRRATAVTIAACVVASLVAAACSSTTSPSSASVESTDTRGRTQMWTENCTRCHNARSPGFYSDRHWQVTMHHMRVRCSMTKAEYDAVLSFLQSAN